jgi:hypothetical protein
MSRRPEEKTSGRQGAFHYQLYGGHHPEKGDIKRLAEFYFKTGHSPEAYQNSARYP